MHLLLPRFYPILNVNMASVSHVAAMAAVLPGSGCSVVQLRAKQAAPKEMLRLAALMKSSMGASLAGEKNTGGCALIMNDRPDLALLAAFDGCHLGQDDLSIAGARKILPRPKILGLSTHNAAQVRAGEATDADYLAIGPVFATVTKSDAAPALGLSEFARLRKLTGKPVVAIGGITRENAWQALDAGADSVAMIGELHRGCTVENFVAQFEQNLRDILSRIL